MMKYFALLIVLCLISVSFAHSQEALETALSEVAILAENENFAEILDVLEPHIDSDDPDVEYHLAFANLNVAFEKTDYDSPGELDTRLAISWARRAANHGSAQALNLLYIIYGQGLGVPLDVEVAMDYLDKAAAAGDDGAKMNLAIMLYGESQDADERVCLWFPELADRDVANPIAIYYLGLILYDGQCETTADAEGGMELIGISADLGYNIAEWEMGRNYEHGWTVEVDSAAATLWYQRAADNGHVHSLWKMGMAYVSGSGVEQDSARAFDFFRRATEGGDLDGAVSLAVMYATGDGVEQDYMRARELYEDAARNGSSQAMKNLAVMYVFGEGMPVDLVEARFLIEKAIVLGNSEAIDVRDLLLERMSPEEEALAEHRFVEWQEE